MSKTWLISVVVDQLILQENSYDWNMLLSSLLRIITMVSLAYYVVGTWNLRCLPGKRGVTVAYLIYNDNGQVYIWII